MTNPPKNQKFALIGAAGYIAPRHMEAVKATNNQIVAALDPSDSVGIIDRYFPKADFFTEFERFDRHIDKLRRKDKGVQYISICSPNYLHDAHIRFALRSGAHAICEKPLVLNPWNLDGLEDFEKEYGKNIYTILQLRLHPSIIKIKEETAKSKAEAKFEIDLTYITSRGNWYLQSWKGDNSKAGGVATNIGIHFFDMLQWVFGKPKDNIVHYNEPTKMAGYLELENANVRWLLSVDARDLPKEVREKEQTTYRNISVNGSEIEFSGGFTDLHTLSYQEILKSNGFGISDARTSIEIVHQIRNADPVGITGDYHPLLKEIHRE